MLTRCKKDDYLINKGVKSVVFIVIRDWVHDPDRRFNVLQAENFNTGHPVNFNSHEQRHDLIVLSKKDKEVYAKKSDARIEKAKKEDSKALKEIEESLEAIYPGNWDIIKGRTLSRLYTITIRFPEITIVNGRGDSHQIKELYVRWVFRNGFRISEGLTGVRGTINYVEYQSGYFHSHLSTYSLSQSDAEAIRFKTFCLGSGEFATLNYDWSISDKNFDQKEFELFLYQLDAYVKWESLAGGPYIRMANIAAGGYRMHLSQSEINKDFLRICKKLTHFPLKFNLLTRKFEVCFSALEDFIANAKETLNMKQGVLGFGVNTVSKTSAGDYLYGDVDPVAIATWITKGNKTFSISPILRFKGEDIYLKIIELKATQENNSLVSVPHPKLTEYIVDKLTKQTNNYFIQKYGV